VAPTAFSKLPVPFRRTSPVIVPLLMRVLLPQPDETARLDAELRLAASSIEMVLLPPPSSVMA